MQRSRRCAAARPGAVVGRLQASSLAVWPRRRSDQGKGPGWQAYSQSPARRGSPRLRASSPLAGRGGGGGGPGEERRVGGLKRSRRCATARPGIVVRRLQAPSLPVRPRWRQRSDLGRARGWAAGRSRIGVLQRVPAPRSTAPGALGEPTRRQRSDPGKGSVCCGWSQCHGRTAPGVLVLGKAEAAVGDGCAAGGHSAAARRLQAASSPGRPRRSQRSDQGKARVQIWCRARRCCQSSASGVS